MCFHLLHSHHQQVKFTNYLGLAQEKDRPLICKDVFYFLFILQLSGPTGASLEKVQHFQETMESPFFSLHFCCVQFHRITWAHKNDTMHKRLVQWNSFIRNTNVHTIHNKWDFTLCCVHHNTHTVSCVNVFSFFFSLSRTLYICICEEVLSTVLNYINQSTTHTCSGCFHLHSGLCQKVLLQCKLLPPSLFLDFSIFNVPRNHFVLVEEVCSLWLCNNHNHLLLYQFLGSFH